MALGIDARERAAIIAKISLLIGLNAARLLLKASLLILMEILAEAEKPSSTTGADYAGLEATRLVATTTMLDSVRKVNTKLHVPSVVKDHKRRP